MLSFHTDRVLMTPTIFPRFSGLPYELMDNKQNYPIQKSAPDLKHQNQGSISKFAHKWSFIFSPMTGTFPRTHSTADLCRTWLRSIVMLHLAPFTDWPIPTPGVMDSSRLCV